jgi:hypothetical protein
MMQLRLTQKASKVIRSTIYPGVNAITLLIEKGDEDALKDADRLVPLVSFAVVRRGGAASSDYWDLATVLELSAIGNEWKLVNRILPKTLAAGKRQALARERGTFAVWANATVCHLDLTLRR